jgi:hypothetical protein
MSQVREVREPYFFEFPVSEMMIFHHVSYGPNGPELIVISKLHEPSSCLINGPDQSLIRRLGLFHDFAYHELERLEHSFL